MVFHDVGCIGIQSALAHRAYPASTITTGSSSKRRAKDKKPPIGKEVLEALPNPLAS